LQLPWISILFIPLLSGIVGYLTNYIAIKMLFRPYTKKWYTLGWQGVIPKNRGKLAKEIGLMVGNKLISNESIKEALFENKFQLVLEKTIHNELKNLLDRELGSLETILTSFGIDTKKIAQKLADYLISSDEFTHTINNNVNLIINDGLKKLSEKKISDYPNLLESLSKVINEIFSNYIIKDELIDHISSNIDDIILSGKSIKELIKIDLDETLQNISNSITNKLIDTLYDVLQKDEVKKKILRKIEDFKNNYFKKGFFNQLKLTAINIILSDETINEIIENEFPKLVNAIKENPELKEKINTSLLEYINKTLRRPIYEYIEKIGFDKFYEYRAKVNHRLKAYIHSENFNIMISQMINSNIEKLSEKEIGEFLNIIKSTDNVENPYNLSIDVPSFIKNSNNKGNIELLLYSLLSSVKLNNLYSNITDKTFEKIITNIKEAINNIIDKNIVDAFNAINISKIISNKINSLPLSGVENLLFSFMKNEFAWINILGFILGFIIGSVEVIILLW
jgi:uncharacterized membrane protein YheB (UPF0754 family)